MVSHTPELLGARRRVDPSSGGASSRVFTELQGLGTCAIVLCAIVCVVCCVGLRRLRLLLRTPG